MNARTLIIAALSGLVLIGAFVFVVRGGDGRDAANGLTAEEVGAGEALPGDRDPAPDGDEAGEVVAEHVADALSASDDDGTADGASPVGPSPSAGGGDPPATPAAGERASGERAAAELTATGRSQDPTDEILRATARRYEGVRSMQADFEQQLTNTILGRTTNSAGTLYQRQPDRFLMRFSDPAGDVVVSDGEFFWLYYPSVDPKQVIRSVRGAGALDLRSQFVGDPVRRFEATSHGRETVRGRQTHVLTLVPREPAGYRRLKAWIDTDDHLVRRFELTEDNGNVRRFDLTDLRINPTLPDALFEFNPPAGAVVVTR